MAIYKVNAGQNIFDVCMEQTGGFDGFIELLNGNEMGFNDVLNAGDSLEVPEQLVQDSTVVLFFSNDRVNTGELDVFSKIEEINFAATIYLSNND